MLSESVEEAIFATFKVLHLTGVLPFSFNYKQDLFYIPKSRFRTVLHTFQNILLIISPIHALYVLRWLYLGNAGILIITQQIVSIGSMVSSTLYLLDITINREDIASLFNRTILLNSKAYFSIIPTIIYNLQNTLIIRH